ncbi:Vms1/Ankzf1 family peptidyl-tRNA hydrolase [Modestobacter sp. Leaf380]|uniref:baeRF2 domain-containing protein n=1 Tax=Modestobacter sp. Leaf380 TaxID=1736356 RepID=UPI0006F1D1A5|nr:Vms1/Ankzf1 family peptidyl-tRNA hydrolase [Modestobacter sp. Leaf380]KQS66300.1 hypothetical protein ASG41_13400 [Modestobacter sp. Leaf380]
MDVSFLTPALQPPGPYATVCADVSHTTEDADTELELRVRGLTEQLAGTGAPEPVVTAVRERLSSGPPEGVSGELRGRALVVGPTGEVLVDTPLARAPLRELVEWAPLPDVTSVLRQLPGRVPHVVVVADRVGADVTVETAPDVVLDEESVDGETFPMRKVPGGGWAHHRYQHTAENTWVHNADRVLAVVDRLAARVGARFVLVAGDVRARQLFRDRAGTELGALTVTMEEGGRAAGADRDVVDRRAAELVAEHEAADQTRVLEQVQAAAAHGLAVTGVAPVVEALRKAQVETLVLPDEGVDEALLVGPDPLQVGVDHADMTALGLDGGTAVPADRALVRAAAGSDAAVVVVPRAAVPGDVPVAAVLRYTDASTPGLTD